MNLLGILQHALGRDQYGRGTDYRNHFCAGGPDLVTCREAVAQGLMREHPASEISGGDPVFTVTDAGKAYVTANSPAPPKLSRGKQRYQEWQASGAADCGLTFGEWLRSGASQGRMWWA